MFSKTFARKLACASVLVMATASTPATAQHIKRIIAFGDSYADTGNALRLAGINPVSTIIYPTGRFSGGSNYVDTLSNLLQVQDFNFAIGGARTDNGNESVGLPGLTFEVQEFNAGGGTLGFPAVTTTLTRSDLVAMSIGGNDARDYQLTGGTLAGAPAAAAVAVTNATNNLNVIMAHGTPTISFLAGDTGQLPEIAGNPTGAAIRTAFSTTYNAGMQQTLAGFARSGSIVHYLDLTSVLNDIKANPTAFGIQGLVCPAIPNPTCIANSSAPFLFYVDNLHLTSVGFAIVGQYVARQLAAPLTLQAPSDMGLDVASEWGRTLSSRGDLYGRGHASGGLHLYVLGDAVQHDMFGTDTNSAFNVSSVGATIGAEYGMPGGMVGIAGNYSRPKVMFGTNDADVRAHSWQVGAYGAMNVGGLFGRAYIGYGNDRDRITRAGVVEGMEADPHGSHTVAGAKGGYLMSFAGLSAGPIVAVDYARARVNGYTETGDPALTLNVGSQEAKTLTGQAGLEVRGDLAGLHPFVDLTAEHNFTDDNATITFAQTDAPGIINSWAIPGRKQTYGRLTGGASATLTGALSVDAFVSTTLGHKGGNVTGGNLGVKVKF